jgi:hypothetical protein
VLEKKEGKLGHFSPQKQTFIQWVLVASPSRQKWWKSENVHTSIFPQACLEDVHQYNDLIFCFRLEYHKFWTIGEQYHLKIYKSVYTTYAIYSGHIKLRKHCAELSCILSVAGALVGYFKYAHFPTELKHTGKEFYSPELHSEESESPAGSIILLHLSFVIFRWCDGRSGGSMIICTEILKKKQRLYSVE